MGENTKRVTRRSLLKGAVVAGLGVALGGTLEGCASGTPPQPTAAPAAAQKPAAQPTAAPAAQPTSAPAPAKLNWPEKNKTMTIIVPWPPGNTADISSRLLAEIYKKELGLANVEVVNKDGAGSQVGMTEFVKAKPDGYTLLAMSVPTSPLIYLDKERNAAFNRKSFEPIAVYAVDPYSFGVLAEKKWKNLKDLVEDAKANPGKITIGTNGYMNATHLVAVNLMQAAGVKFSLAHFDGAATLLTGLLGGHVDVACTGPTMQQHVKSGKVRLLGVTTEKPTELFPGGVPFKDQGYNVLSYVTRGHVAVGGTPKEIVDRLAGIIKEATEDADFKQKMAAKSSDVQYWGPAQYAADWDNQDKDVQAAIAEVKATK